MKEYYDNLLKIIQDGDGMAAQEYLFRLRQSQLKFNVNLEYAYPQAYNNTLLILAAKDGLIDFAYELICLGANVNATGDKNFTALHCAARAGHTMIIWHLLQAKADIEAKIAGTSATPLHVAAQKGHQAAVSFLLGRGAKVNAKTSDGTTALHMACYHGHEKVVERLLHQPGIELEAQDRVGITPLMLAKKNGFTAIVKLLEAAKHNNNISLQGSIITQPLVIKRIMETKENNCEKDPKKAKFSEKSLYILNFSPWPSPFNVSEKGKLTTIVESDSEQEGYDKRVAIRAKQFGHRDPELYAHDATTFFRARPTSAMPCTSRCGLASTNDSTA